MNVAIVGCGLIGNKRSRALAGTKLVACVDPNVNKAHAIAKDHEDCDVSADWREVISRKDVEVIIIATPNYLFGEILEAAVVSGKHVLIEKPAARFASELKVIRKKVLASNVLVHVGFNHRYHRAFRNARAIVDSGVLGPLMFLRARYGHGGRLGYDGEWRANPELSGGGELIDQGVHLIDLSRWFLGDIVDVQGVAHTYFWDMPVDDNAFLTMKTEAGQTSHIHVSCTEWKNTFSFELYGRDGKIEINGLGGSYGVERLTHYKMLPEMGPPETYAWEYPMADNSWECEMREFLSEIRIGAQTSPNLDDAIASLEIVEKVYKESGYDYSS